MLTARIPFGESAGNAVHLISTTGLRTRRLPCLPMPRQARLSAKGEEWGVGVVGGGGGGGLVVKAQSVAELRKGSC